MEKKLNHLKLKIQAYGALRPEAWEAILEHARYTEIKAGENFIRIPDTFAYIANGLIKEYNPYLRKTPAIVNFIGVNQCLYTKKYNQSNYLKACLPTLVIHWGFDSLLALYQKFPELKLVYDTFCASYNNALENRQLILEQKSFIEKIRLFKEAFPNQIVFLKKKDITNYLQVNYNYFVHHWMTQL